MPDIACDVGIFQLIITGGWIGFEFFSGNTQEKNPRNTFRSSLRISFYFSIGVNQWLPFSGVIAFVSVACSPAKRPVSFLFI